MISILTSSSSIKYFKNLFKTSSSISENYKIFKSKRKSKINKTYIFLIFFSKFFIPIIVKRKRTGSIGILYLGLPIPAVDMRKGSEINKRKIIGQKFFSFFFVFVFRVCDSFLFLSVFFCFF